MYHGCITYASGDGIVAVHIFRYSTHFLLFLSLDMVIFPACITQSVLPVPPFRLGPLSLTRVKSTLTVYYSRSPRSSMVLTLSDMFDSDFYLVQTYFMIHPHWLLSTRPRTYLWSQPVVLYDYYFTLYLADILHQKVL